MERLVKLALRIITVLILLATVVSFSESYHGLFEWAITHNVQWFWAMIWPLMLDTVILVGECSVFVAIHKHWRLRHRFWAWAVTFTGLSVSTLANGGHVASRDWLTHVTNALPPIALMFALTVGLGVLKRTRMMGNPPDSTPAVQDLAPGRAPLTKMVRTGTERSHVGTKPLIENALPGFAPPTETPVTPEVERPAPVIPDPDSDPEATRIEPGLRTIPGKSFTMPPDPRKGLSLADRRVRDMYDVDPDIAVNAIAKALGIAWATADKLLKATKEARGLK